MIAVDISEAKARLSTLVDQAARGESFMIVKAGRPLVRVTALDAHTGTQRLGFLVGEIAVPDDFDRMGDAEIATLFNSNPRRPASTVVTDSPIGLRR